MTLQQLRECMSAEELLLWMAYDSESPLGDVRGDIQASIIAASAFQAQGAKVTAMDLMPKWGGQQGLESVEELEIDQGEEMFKRYLMGRAGG